jgi:YVTN family beta-propeller protein
MPMRNLAIRSCTSGLCVALLFLSGCGGGGSGGESEDTQGKNENQLVVRSITPTNRQEVNGDLSDPGLEGVVTVNFSEGLDRSYFLDPANAFNGLTSDVNILNSAFERVRGTPEIVGDIDNVLVFWPQGDLPNGQYTITVTRDVKDRNGDLLNQGQFDFRSSFTVGADLFKPKIRNTYPAPNQTDVDRQSQIIITFNESVSPATVTASTVTVTNATASPPVQVNGTIATARDDFEVVFTPDPANPLPANATIVVQVIGGASGVADALGNTFEDQVNTPADDHYVFQFQTVVEPPPPNNPIPVDLVNFDALIVYGTGQKIGTLQEAQFYIDTRDLTRWGINNPIPNSERWIGQPEEIIFDPRFGPLDSHTWLYIIDRASRSVTIVGTRDCRIVHRWKDMPDPRGLAVTPNGLTLYVTNYSSDSVSAIDIGSVTPGASLATQLLKDLTKPRNLQNPAAGGSRLDIGVGRGPIGAAHGPDAANLFIANNVDNSCTLINSGTAKVNTTFPVGTGPQDVSASFYINPVGWFAIVTCLGAPPADMGSVSMWWSRPNGLQANVTGFNNPKGCIYDWALSWWVANAGGTTVTRLTLAVAGGGFAATILPNITADITVGKNPTSCTLEPISLYLGAPSRVVITADSGSSQISFVDQAQPTRPIYSLPIPGVREVASYIDQ